MKRSFALILSLLILAGASMVSADVSAERTRPGQHKTQKGKHKKGSRLDPYKNEKGGSNSGKVNPDLNPQPLPPGIKAPPGQGGTEAK